MTLNRIIVIGLIIITGTLASIYGGNISYALFYMALIIPAVAFLYTVYVYVRFKLYQSIGKRTVIKGEATEYVFQLSNEDFLAYENIKVNFYHDKSKIIGSDEEKEYSLLPGEKQSIETLICCNYRGEYYVGAETVTITDFLYLFTVTYPVFSKMKVTVLPRVVSLASLRMLSPDLDTKGRIKRLKEDEEEPDLEVRKYVNGDNKRRIHWKTSAKKQELLIRKYTSIPKTGVVVFMDLNAIKEDDLTKVIVEDKIIESGLAIADYCKRKKVSCSLYYDQSGIRNCKIQNQTDFDLLYRQCVDLRFASDKNVDDLVHNAEIMGDIKPAANIEKFIIITHFINEKLYKTMLKLLGYGSECSVLFIADRYNHETEHIMKLMTEAGVGLTIMNHKDEISDLL